VTMARLQADSARPLGRLAHCRALCVTPGQAASEVGSKALDHIGSKVLGAEMGEEILEDFTIRRYSNNLDASEGGELARPPHRPFRPARSRGPQRTASA
jgi:hypothetical protein